MPINTAESHAANIRLVTSAPNLDGYAANLAAKLEMNHEEENQAAKLRYVKSDVQLKRNVSIYSGLNFKNENEK